MPWEEGKLQVEPEGSTHVLKLMNPSDVPLEQIAQQEPDLILAGALASNEEIYKKLQDVAPLSRRWLTVSWIPGRTKPRLLASCSRRKVRQTILLPQRNRSCRL